MEKSGEEIPQPPLSGTFQSPVNASIEIALTEVVWQGVLGNTAHVIPWDT